MKGNMNNSFINRNRIYRMNKNAAMNENVIINTDLFYLPDALANAESINFNIDRSIRPFAIGVFTSNLDDKKYYFAYENDIHSENKNTIEFDKFNDAVKFAQELYNYRISERNIVYKYEKDTKIHRK